jgi:GNAT superfamily N-acetyltransferase
MPEGTIRDATQDDVPLILEFIRALAEYERLSHLVTATEAILRESLFGPRPGAQALLAFEGDTPVGFAVYFHNFSTFLGRSGMWLEDLFVKPAYRGCGYGKALLHRAGQIAHERGCGRFEWSVLDWSTPSIEFYRSLGAEPLSDWTIFRMTGKSLEQFAHRSKKPFSLREKGGDEGKN